jgi:plastocyanin
MFSVAVFVVAISGIAGSQIGRKALAQTVKENPAQEKQMTSEIKIDNFSFSPQSLSVPAGSTVTWTNHDDIPHTVVSTDDPKVFKSKVLDSDEKFSFTFSKAGTYTYFCSIHPKMTGKVVVN